MFERKFAPFLVQRIEKPRFDLPTEQEFKNIPSLVEYYSVPKEQKTKELRDKFMASLEALNNCIPLDYMGSAEYEFGAVPETLRQIVASRDNLIPFTLSLAGIPYVLWGDHHHVVASQNKQTKVVTGWCQKEHKEDLETFLTKQSTGEVARLKEVMGFQEGLFGRVDTYGKSKKLEICYPDRTGWLDLNNLWFVGTHQPQINLFKYLLGINF